MNGFLSATALSFAVIFVAELGDKSQLMALTFATRFRTWPDPDATTDPVRFVALGDYGVGIRADSESSRRQRRIAEVLDRLVSDGDVRFVVSLGDNIYQGEQGHVDDESGGEDAPIELYCF